MAIYAIKQVFLPCGSFFYNPKKELVNMKEPTKISLKFKILLKLLRRTKMLHSGGWMDS